LVTKESRDPDGDEDETAQNDVDLCEFPFHRGCLTRRHGREQRGFADRKQI
jgi:hypothetical protein